MRRAWASITTAVRRPARVNLPGKVAATGLISIKHCKEKKLSLHTLIRLLRQVRHPVLVRLFTSLVLCLAGATIRLGSVVEGRGTRVPGPKAYGEGICMFR